MKIVISFLAVALVFGCVAVHFSNKYFETDNIPMSLNELYNSLASLGTFGDIFKAALDDFGEALDAINKYDLGEFPDASDGLTWQEIIDLAVSHSFSLKLSVISWHVITIIFGTVIDILVYVFNVLSLIAKFIFGVPRPSTLMFAIA